MKNSKPLASLQAFCCTVVLLLGVSSAAWAETDAYKLLPDDEAQRDLQLVQFRNELLQVVKFREPEKLVTMIDFNIQNGSNLEDGARAFAEIWRIDAQDSPLWSTMETILNMGGAFIRSNRGVRFCAPYVFTHFPSDLDLKTNGAIVNASVALKAAPQINSPTVASLSYDIVKVRDWTGQKEIIEGNTPINWIAAETYSGQKGFVSAEDIRSPQDYHVCLLMRKDHWRVISMISHIKEKDGPALQKKAPKDDEGGDETQ